MYVSLQSIETSLECIVSIVDDLLSLGGQEALYFRDFAQEPGMCSLGLGEELIRSAIGLGEGVCCVFGVIRGLWYA